MEREKLGKEEALIDTGRIKKINSKKLGGIKECQK